jgi:hypothetical protein
MNHVTLKKLSRFFLKWESLDIIKSLFFSFNQMFYLFIYEYQFHLEY